jgi:hypothetical protein
LGGFSRCKLNIPYYCKKCKFLLFIRYFYKIS